MATDELMTKALAALGEVDGPMSVEVIHHLADTSQATEPMTIAEVADLLDISAHTLRYYERAGLVDVDRDSSGHRSYSPESVRRLVFLTRMRLSGMGIRDLQHYVALVDQGDDTVPNGSTCCSNTATPFAARSESSRCHSRRPSTRSPLTAATPAKPDQLPS